MKLFEIISPHTPAELSNDYLQDPSNGELTQYIISEYASVLQSSNNLQLSAYGAYAPDYDSLLFVYRSLPENYVNYTKAGKMLKEMIQYFSET